jgi:hypothetical protein
MDHEQRNHSRPHSFRIRTFRDQPKTNVTPFTRLKEAALAILGVFELPASETFEKDRNLRTALRHGVCIRSQVILPNRVEARKALANSRAKIRLLIRKRHEVQAGDTIGTQ